MVSYDRAEVSALAERLNFQARLTVIAAVVLGAAAGATILAIAFPAKVSMAEIFVSGGFGALAGGIWGRSRAALLGVQAQMVLCQAQIELNTRAASAAVHDGAREARMG